MKNFFDKLLNQFFENIFFYFNYLYKLICLSVFIIIFSIFFIILKKYNFFVKYSFYLDENLKKKLKLFLILIKNFLRIF